MTSMPTLSRQQVLKLSREATELANWMQVNAFATQIYGEDKAAKVTIEIYEEYNDETYDYPIGNVTAYDVNGKKLLPDYTLPFFQTEAWKNAKKSYQEEYGDDRYEEEQDDEDDEEENEDNDEIEDDYYEYDECSVSNFVATLNEVSIPSHYEKSNWPWILIEDLPDDDATYDLTTTPSLTLPTQG